MLTIITLNQFISEVVRYFHGGIVQYMREILLDNLSVFHLPINRDFDKNNTYFQNYIFSLVLWDKIICIQPMDIGRVDSAEMVTLWQLRNRLRMDYINKKLGIEYVKIHNYHQYIEKSRDIVSNINVEIEDSQIAEDAIRYILLGYNLNVNICLSGERTQFIKINHYNDYIFNRLDVINLVETGVKEFYDEINRKIGKKIICFESPLLVDYVCSESENFTQAVRMAMKLKKEKHLVEYRRAMDEMEKCLNEGNFVKFNEYLSIIPDIVNSIQTAGIKTQSFVIGLKPIPSISTNLDLVFSKPIYKKLHMHFIKDIVKFGMTERLDRI